MRGRGRVRCTGGGLRRVPQPSREPTPRPHLSPDRSRPGATPALRLAGPLPGLARDRSAVAAPGVSRNPANCEKAALSCGVVPSQASFSHSVFPIVQTLGGGETFCGGPPRRAARLSAGKARGPAGNADPQGTATAERTRSKRSIVRDLGPARPRASGDVRRVGGPKTRRRALGSCGTLQSACRPRRRRR